jgi:hypothetical protein
MPGALTEAFAALLHDFVIPEPVLEWLSDAVLASDRTEQAARAETIKKLQGRCDQIETRIGTMYMDKLDGSITQEFFDKQAATFRREQDGLRRRIQDVQDSAPAPVDQAIDILQLTSHASELFLEQPFDEQRRLLRVMIDTATWRDGGLRTTLFEPFQILRHSNQESRRKENENFGSGRDLEVWLPRNTVVQLILSRFLHVAGGPAWIQTGRTPCAISFPSSYLTAK